MLPLRSELGRRVAIVILAAGASSRMGQPKLLLEWQGKSLVRRAAELALASGADSVTLVTGPRDAEMRQELQDLPVQVVNNPSFAEGMSTSLRVGIDTLGYETDVVLVMLADQPLMTLDVVQRLLQTLRTVDALIVQPRYAGVPGNPVGFQRALFADLMAQNGDQGARQIVRQHRDEIHFVDFAESAHQRDIDTPEDYEMLRSQTGVD